MCLHIKIGWKRNYRHNSDSTIPMMTSVHCSHENWITQSIYNTKGQESWWTRSNKISSQWLAKLVQRRINHYNHDLNSVMCYDVAICWIHVHAWLVRDTNHHTEHNSPHPGLSLQLYSTHRRDTLVLGDQDSAKHLPTTVLGD